MSETVAPSGLFDRAIRRITNVWRDMAASVSGEEGETIADQMRACLVARGGEVSARNRAAKLARAYLALDAAGRIDFLRTLAGFDSNPEAMAAAYADLQAATDPAERALAKAGLRRGARAAAGAAADAVHHHPRRDEVPGRSARHRPRGAGRRAAAGAARGGSAPPARQLVRRRLPRIEADRLEQPGLAAGAAGRL